MTTLLIVDDHQLLRDALAEHARRANYRVVAGVGDAQSALTESLQHKPDLVLLDVEMPGRDALSAIGDIRAASPDSRIVILTAYCRDTYIQLALDSGAAGYLLKSDHPVEIFEALERANRGERVFSRLVMDRLTRRGAENTGPSDRQSRLTSLSRREIEVLRYIGQGLTNPEMAGRMTISQRTVERHVARLMDAVAIHDRCSLQRFAAEQGLAS
jgi:DNA-binding NarL/FixJ family response regulator